jgi:hypothetical protein
MSLLLLVSTVMAISCNKNDSVVEPTAAQEEISAPGAVATESKQQSLFANSSSSTETGYFKINKLENGNAAVEVILDESLSASGSKLKVQLVAIDGDTNEDEVFADLGEVSSATGAGSKNAVTLATADTPIKYDDLITMQGFRIRVTDGSKVVSEAVMM